MSRALRAIGLGVVVLAGSGFGAWHAAAEPVTILAQPTVLGRDQTLKLFGSVGSGEADEVVRIEARDCGQTSFREVAAVRTRAGGGWSTELSPWVTSTLRAVWKGTASVPVTVRQRARVSLTKERDGFAVWVVGKHQFWRRHVLFQRFDRRLGTWRTVKPVVLTETGANDPTGRTATVWSRAVFRSSLPKGSLVRAVFPLSQARPCYLEGSSRLVRT